MSSTKNAVGLKSPTNHEDSVTKDKRPLSVLCDFGTFSPQLSDAQSLSTLTHKAINHHGFTGLCHSE